VRADRRCALSSPYHAHPVPPNPPVCASSPNHYDHHDHHTTTTVCHGDCARQPLLRPNEVRCRRGGAGESGASIPVHYYTPPTGPPLHCGHRSFTQPPHLSSTASLTPEPQRPTEPLTSSHILKLTLLLTSRDFCSRAPHLPYLFQASSRGLCWCRASVGTPGAEEP
jgi:hypothetical protein